MLRNLLKTAAVAMLLAAHTATAAFIDISSLSGLTVNEGELVQIRVYAKATDGYHLTGTYEGGGTFSFNYGFGSSVNISYNFPSTAPDDWTATMHQRYLQDGVYKVTVSGTISEHLDSNHKGSQKIQVSDSLLLTVRNVAPVISYITEDLFVGVNELFSFDSRAYDASYTDVLSFAWDLNQDGVYDDLMQQNGKHSFATPGIYNLSLRVSDDDESVYRNMKVTVAAPAATSVVSAPGSLLLLTLGLALLRLRRR